MVSETFHDPVSPAQKSHITSILFASIYAKYISPLLEFCSHTDSWYMLHIALITLD